MTIEDSTHSGSQNVVGKFTLHTVQNPQNQKSKSIPRSTIVSRWLSPMNSMRSQYLWSHVSTNTTTLTNPSIKTTFWEHWKPIISTYPRGCELRYGTKTTESECSSRAHILSKCETVLVSVYLIELDVHLQHTDNYCSDYSHSKGKIKSVKTFMHSEY